MSINIMINDDLLANVLKLTGINLKREAVEQSL
ncbi:type II toxin-antitoxin system VapB family antitoxin [Methylobacter sp. S3L5C]|nr:type II toxin-antitoxin system VapB family antitoxin [Methylobacter sp. S3L5C]UOA09586.1 type II toxin-antitoxin system VapB family antitoxin [Methylobacter sp. S3L5C]